MAKAKGRTLSISPFRRLVIDLMHFSQKVPSCTADRTMDLAPLMAARAAVFPRPSWTALFSKAYGMLGRDYPDLRRSYLSFPWGRLYEHPHSIVTLNVERHLPDGEGIVVYCHVRAPENRSLAEIDGIINHHKEAPLESLRSFTRSRLLGSLPWFLRRFVWWGALNFFGRRRCHNYGTFGITSVGSLGAGLLRLIPLLTSTIHYGMFEKDHSLNVRLSFDHRVMDGATVARVLVDLEKTLNGAMVAECLQSRRLAA